MRRKWLFTCMTALLFAHTSCVTDATIMEVETSSVESRNFTTERKVQELVQQARFGKDEAYKSLAFCYRDGKGIEESNLNAIFMYLVYCQKTGQDLKTSIELFEEGSPYRLLIEILSSPIQASGKCFTPFATWSRSVRTVSQEYLSVSPRTSATIFPELPSTAALTAT